MNGDAQGGTNMAKMIIGVVLMAAGNLMAIRGYPSMPVLPMPSHSAPMQPGTMPMPDIAGLGQLLPNYFMVLMTSLLLMNVGAIFVYLSREPKSA